MNCHRAEELISAMIDCELDDDARLSLDGHLAECALCRETADSLQRQHASLGRAFAPRRQAAARVAAGVLDQLSQKRPNRRTMLPESPLPWSPMLVSAAAGFVLAVALFRPWQDRTQAVIPTAARLGLAIGQVEILRPGQASWQSLPSGGIVEVGAAVRTGTDARCELATSEGTFVRMNVDTQLRFEAQGAVRLTSGQVYGCPTSQAPMLVKASDTTITAAQGRFDLVCLPDVEQVVLTAVEGKIDVFAQGKKQTVQRGNRVKIVDGTIVEQRPVADLIMATNWIHGILARKGDDDVELTQRVDALLASLGEAKMSYLYEEEIRAMGATCCLPLTKFIESSRSDARPHQRRNAARILADIAPSSSVGELIGLLSDSDATVRSYAAGGLTRLTGLDHGLPPDGWSKPWADCEKTHELWLTWWEENKSHYERGR